MNEAISRILLVDDEEGIRKVLGISLMDLGYEVRTAKDGAEALNVFSDYHPSIILTDIKMPVMDGIQLLRKIKDRSPDTEVIMITGHGDLDLAIQSLKFEATDFVTKPINDEILEIALKRAEERITLRRQLRDYTENLERLVEEKSRKIVEAERLAAVGQTVAGLSHSIKNIAGGLKGGAFVLEKGIDLENREYLRQGWNMLRGNIDKITRLSLDLLDYAKSAQLNFQRCHPNTPLEEIAELLAIRAEENRIRLVMRLDEKLDALYFDPEAIHRCLLNLVSNAFDAFRDEEENDAEKRVTLRSRRLDSGVEYRIEDNGCGMDAEVKEKLFQRFYTTKGSRGTGIGLMLTKKIVDEHGGEIRFESEPGKGSRFIIRLPGGGPGPVESAHEELAA